MKCFVFNANPSNIGLLGELLIQIQSIQIKHLVKLYRNGLVFL